MALDKNIKAILHNNISNPSFLLDSELRLLDFNHEAKKLISDLTKKNKLFEYFSKHTAQFLERMILEAANFERAVKETLDIEFKNNDEFISDINVTILPLEIDDNDYYIVTFIKTEQIKAQVNGKAKFNVLTSEIDDIISNAGLAGILSTIKSAYPFSLIEKSKFQSEIDKLKITFWIKNSEDKFIIANKEFANSFGLKPAQIEGRLEKDLLPAHLVTLYQSVNQYIKETCNTVIFEGIRAFGDEGKSVSEVVVFPITDIDNKVTAIVGFTHNPTEITYDTHFENYITKVIEESDEAKVITEADTKIISASYGLKKLLGLNRTLSLTNKFLTQFVGSDFAQQLKYHSNSFSKKRVSFTYSAVLEDGIQRDLLAKVSIIEMENSEVIFDISLEIKKNEAEVSTTNNVLTNTLLLNNPEPIFIYDVENLKFLEVNNSALKLYGYSKEKFLEMDLTDLYSPEDIQTLLETSAGNIKNNKFTGPWRQKRSDGKAIFVEISKTELSYNNKRAHLNIVKDISEKISTEKQLQVFKTTFESSVDLIFVTDRDGFISYSNKLAEEKLGFLETEFDSKPFISLVSDSDRGKINSSIFQANDFEKESFSVQLKNISGDLLNVVIDATAVHNYNGEVESFVLIARLQPILDENSYVNNAPAVTNSVNSELDNAFLSNLFHELLTPINVIVGFVQEISDSLESPSAEQEESVEIIRENQKILLNTMDTAVEYSQVVSNNITFNRDNIVFVDLIDSIEEANKRYCKTNNKELSYSKISSSLKFVTDKQRFLSLINLFVQFALKMTSQKSIFLSAYPNDDESFIVSVKDSRKNISDELLKNLQDLFTADESLLRHNYGISRFTIRLARKMVELMTLRKEVLKKSGKSTEFALLFPLNIEQKESENVHISEEATSEINVPEKIEQLGVSVEPLSNDSKQVKEETIQSNLKEEKVIESNEKEEVNSGGTNSNIDYSQLSCLYVEDQIDSQILFKVQMKELKLIDYSTSFEDAVPLLKSKSYNFIVMDINLQGEYNGLDALRLIRKMPAYQDIPIIAASAYVLPGDKEKFIAAGFNDFISKPVLQDKLYESLEKVFK